MRRHSLCYIVFVSLLATTASSAQTQRTDLLKAMVLTGQNNHGWQVLSAHYRDILEETGLFEVDVVTSPSSGADMTGFNPDFDSYDVVVFEYNGDRWPTAVEASFERYMQNGGGMVFGHAVNHTFKDWRAFNEMMGIGGWGGRDESAGPFVKYRNGQLVLDHSPGHPGECVDAHEYSVVTRAPEHPIMRGLPSVWLHGTDELYSNQRGPAKNMTILATAYSDPAREAHWGERTHGTGEHEPMVHTVRFGRGRVFGTAMGHVDGGAPMGSGPWPAMECIGFITMIQRGAEWAATGNVTQPVPHRFPTATATQFR